MKRRVGSKTDFLLESNNKFAETLTLQADETISHANFQENLREF